MDKCGPDFLFLVLGVFLDVDLVSFEEIAPGRKLHNDTQRFGALIVEGLLKSNDVFVVVGG